MNRIHFTNLAMLMTLSVSLCVCAQAVDDDPMPTGLVADLPGADSVGSEAEEWSSTFLLLEDRPLHLQFRITIDGVSLSQARENGVRDLIRQLDTDKDGKLSHDEFQKSPLVRKVARPKARKFLQSLGPQPDPAPEDIRAQFARVAGGASLSIRADASTAKDDTAIYDLIDADSSGLIDLDELSRAEIRLRQKDSDHDYCVSFEEFQPTVINQQLVVANLPEEERAKSMLSEMMIQSQSSRQLHPALLKKYDADKDKRLSAAELSWSEETYSKLDVDMDGHIDSYELQAAPTVPFDLQLTVELNPQDDKTPAITLLKTRLDAIIESERTDLVTVRTPSMRLMLASRTSDPVEEAVTNAMQGFNELDTDSNGYID
ncbi:MAG: hypothetical protein O2856_16130, partial [Planctomycetota bacterium]|nr:hypothetical protein [Planctomycetota bacterium]